MLEAVLIALSLSVIQWWSSPWSYAIAGILLLLCLPGVLVMRGAAPFVTTPKKTVRAMIALAAIRPGEIVMDLGCGDGRLVFAAAKKGAIATGFAVLNQNLAAVGLVILIAIILFFILKE